MFTHASRRKSFGDAHHTHTHTHTSIKDTSRRYRTIGNFHWANFNIIATILDLHVGNLDIPVIQLSDG